MFPPMFSVPPTSTQPHEQQQQTNHPTMMPAHEQSWEQQQEALLKQQQQLLLQQQQFLRQQFELLQQQTQQFYRNMTVSSPTSSAFEQQHVMKTSTISCAQCREDHKKCSRLLPYCTSCLDRGIKCHYPTPKKRSHAFTENNNRQSSTAELLINNNNAPQPSSLHVPPSTTSDNYTFDRPLKHAKINHQYHHQPTLTTTTSATTATTETTATIGNNNNTSCENVENTLLNNNNSEREQSTSEMIRHMIDACFFIHPPPKQQQQQQEEKLPSVTKNHSNSINNSNNNSDNYNNSDNSSNSSNIRNDDDDETSQFEQMLIAKLLNHHFATQLKEQKKKKNNSEEDKKDDEEWVEQMANRALWFSVTGLALFNMPSLEQLPYFDSNRQKQVIEIMSQKLQDIRQILLFGENTDSVGQGGEEEKAENTTEDFEQWFGLFCKLPKQCLIQVSKFMLSQARETLLDERVFSRVSSHLKLAYASQLLVVFLLSFGVTDEGLSEARLFMNCVKVYLKMHAKTPFSDESERGKEQRQYFVSQLHVVHSGLKSFMWLNFAPRDGRLYNQKSLRKYLKLSIRTCKHVPHTQDTIKRLKKMKKIVQRNMLDVGPPDLDQLNDFLNECREMRGRNHGTGLAKGWQFFTFSYEIFALEIAAYRAEMCKDQEACDSVWQLQLESANIVNSFMSRNVGIGITAGARILTIFRFTCRVHIEQSTRLCKSRSRNKRELSECLSCLKTYCLIMDGIEAKIHVEDIKKLSIQIKQQVKDHNEYMSKLDDSILELVPVTPTLSFLNDVEVIHQDEQAFLNLFLDNEHCFIEEENELDFCYE